MFARRVQQAGAIVFRLTSGQPEVLLVRGKKNPSHWVFPKGHIEPGETAVAAAAREVREEAGVKGRVVREVGSLRFKSGSEPVRVRYFLLQAGEDTVPMESREKQWTSPTEALRTLTHPDARQLLRDALHDIREEALLARAGRTEGGDPAFTELLLAEYEHTADSLLRNEEDGEKRATFFVTLAGASGTALAFLLGRDAVLHPDSTHPLVVGALGVVLAVGYLAFLRVLQRNLASDRYKRALTRIRRHFVAGPEDPRRVLLAFDPYALEHRSAPSWRSLGRGGWLETVALVESLVAGALVATVVPTPTWTVEIVVSALAAFATWVLLLGDAARRYDRGHRHRASGDLF